jgi:Na+-translocating ferredoxin:NAD+ oxidoreductase RNF subunit RnfB
VQDTRALTLSFEVSGPPPVRTEALSLLAAGHRQATRVRALLQAACTAAQHSGWTPLTEPVALDVVLRCPPGGRTADAAALIGGIGSVLQDKRRMADIGLAHLGVLADVTLYVDDRQIRRISYREEPAEAMSYLVRVTALPQTV